VVFFLLHPTLSTISRIVLGILLTVSGALKLPNIRGFRAIVIGYGLLPIWLARIMGTLHPFIELANGIVLLAIPWIANPATRWVVTVIAAAHAFLILLVATIFILSAMAKRSKMSNCGCFGTAIKVPLGWHKVVENAVWMLLALQLFFSQIIPP
jgi:hypothetical protein